MMKWLGVSLVLDSIGKKKKIYLLYQGHFPEIAYL